MRQALLGYTRAYIHNDINVLALTKGKGDGFPSPKESQYLFKLYFESDTQILFSKVLFCYKQIFILKADYKNPE